MFTTNKIKGYFDQIQKSLDLSTYKGLEETQKRKEDNLLADYTPCPANKGSNIALNLHTLKSNYISELSKKQFYNLSLMDYLSCLTDVTFNLPRYRAGNLSESAGVRQLIKNVRQIGAESVNGYAMKASFKEAKDLYILKATRNILNDELTHELAVGLLGTNRLRQYCPNFAYIYGGFRCSPPVIEDKEVKAFCTTSDRNGIQYVVYENVNLEGKTISLADYVKTCTGQQFLNVYLQVLYALDKAVEICDFTHYDLHSENVLIRPLPFEGKAYIPYMSDSGKFIKLECENIATIIDFGYSHIRTSKGNNFGLFGLQSYSVLPDASFPMYDAYKLLMFSALSMVTAENQSAYEMAEKIFKFFNQEEDLVDCLNNQNSLYYSLPYAKDFTLKHKDLIRFIRSNCDCSFITDLSESTKEEKAKMLVCQDQCYSFDQIDTRTRPVGYSSPSSLWSLYDKAYLYQNVKKEEYVKLLKSFEKEMKEETEEGYKALETLEKVAIDFSSADFGDISQKEVKELSERFENMTKYLLLLRDVIIYLETMVEVVNKFIEIGFPSSKVVNKNKGNIVKLEEEYKKYKQVCLNNIDKIKEQGLTKYFNGAIMLFKFNS
jgi:hypothetical protein